MDFILVFLPEGEGGRIGRMRGYAKLSKSSHFFSSHNSLTHH
jgi:hypothetical protein